MSLRFIERDGKKILQEKCASIEDPLIAKWRDVPLEPDEPEYIIREYAIQTPGNMMTLVRLIDERLVEKLVDSLWSDLTTDGEKGDAIREYRKWVPKI